MVAGWVLPPAAFRVRLRWHAGLGPRDLGYDPERDVFPSTVYASMLGVPIPYEYDIQGEDVTIRTEFLGATFTGKASKDGETFSGGWRPMPGRKGAGNVAYDVTGTRIS